MRKLWSHHRDNATAIAVIVGTLIAAAILALTLLSLEDSRKAQAHARAAEATAQAERISAGTIAGQSEFPQTEYPNHRLVTRVGLYNRSNAPISNAVVTLVLVQGAGPNSASS